MGTRFGFQVRPKGIVLTKSNNLLAFRHISTWRVFSTDRLLGERDVMLRI